MLAFKKNKSNDEFAKFSISNNNKEPINKLKKLSKSKKISKSKKLSRSENLLIKNIIRKSNF